MSGRTANRRRAARPSAALSALDHDALGDAWTCRKAHADVRIPGGEWAGDIETHAGDPSRAMLDLELTRLLGPDYATGPVETSRLSIEEFRLVDLEPLGRLLLGLAALCRRDGLLPAEE